MKKVRRITEAEVIADFLRGEFFHSEYDTDREQFSEIVNHPDLTNERENEIRRALLFRRRDTMWWELPEDRQWWEIDFSPEDVDQVSVFPRAQWRKIARGNRSARHVAARVREMLGQKTPDAFALKMAAVCAQMHSGVPAGLIIFIGLDEHHPVTVLEGNHRFIAALLASGPAALRGTRIVGVFSPKMEQCCWYITNFRTLFRCLKNRIKHKWNRDPDVRRLLKQAAQVQSVSSYVDSARPVKSK
jgi:hypothetical protein